VADGATQVAARLVEVGDRLWRGPGSVPPYQWTTVTASGPDASGQWWRIVCRDRTEFWKRPGAKVPVQRRPGKVGR
jgi:hypothetical protein